MAEYIERAALLKKLTTCGAICEFGECLIKQFPTADVAPVVHGRWIEDWSGIITCSECKRGYNLIAKFTNYCPNCGAKMDGGGTE